MIIQCDKEGHHAKNTARLLPKLSNNIKIIHESDEPSLAVLKSTGIKMLKTALLFPSETAIAINEFKKTDEDSIQQLIVIDGTWRKAKKLILTQQWLASLPQVSLSQHYESQYAIRKTTVDNGLSTLEAVAYALAEIEGQSLSNLTPFFTLLEGINTMFIQHMPADIKQRYKE